MKRLGGLVVLLALCSSAEAGTISFSVGGHRVRIEAPRGCTSSSCASISVSGVYESRRKREDDTRNSIAPPLPPPPVQVAPPPPAPAPAPVQQSAPAAPVIAAAPPPPAVYTTAAVATQDVTPPPAAAAVQPVIVTQPCATPPVKKAAEPSRPAPALTKVLHQEEPDSPLGDWQTEGKGMVRIAECGRALCGYAIREGESEKGEAILINMKPNTESKWIGSVYSRDSGDTYYGTLRLRGPNTLVVEACAFSRFYCNSNNWTRIERPQPMLTSRQTAQQPRS